MDAFNNQGLFTPGSGQLDMLRKALALNKSLEVGQGAPWSGEGGFALIPQALQPTLAVATAKLKHIRFYKALPKPDNDVVSPFVEYTRQTEIGSDLDPFVSEGGVPQTDNSVFERLFARVKYAATRRSVTDIMAQATTLGGLTPSAMNAVEIETLNGLIYLLKQMDKSLFWADSDANPLAWDGIFKAVLDAAPENDFDLRGDMMTPEKIQDIAAVMTEEGRYAMPDNLWMPPTVRNDLGKLASQRLTYGLANDGSEIQVVPKAIDVGNDVPISFETDIFLKLPILRDETGAGDQIPATPAIASLTANDNADKFEFADDEQGTYWYKVVAFTSRGKSAASQAVSVDNTGHTRVDVTITPNSSLPAGSYFKVYRTALNAGETSKYYLIGQIAANGNQAVVFHDDNKIIAGTENAVMIEMQPEVIQFRHILPPVRLPLARVGLELPFMIVAFGMPIYELPTKIALIRNIGRVTG